MSAVVYDFDSKRKPQTRQDLCLGLLGKNEVTQLSKVKKKRLENYLFEVTLLRKLKQGFLDSETQFFESDLIESDLNQSDNHVLNQSDNEILQLSSEGDFFSANGKFSAFYGIFFVNFYCTGNNHVKFNYCFDNPNLERCKADFPQEHFKLSFGNHSRAMNDFEDYLSKFVLTGELHPGNFSGSKPVMLQNLKNPYQNMKEEFKGYRVKLVEPMLMHSIKEYLGKFNVDC